nr:MAG TPA: hypothetical protein [Caudoviricetes sp.]
MLLSGMNAKRRSDCNSFPVLMAIFRLVRF